MLAAGLLILGPVHTASVPTVGAVVRCGPWAVCWLAGCVVESEMVGGVRSVCGCVCVGGGALRVCGGLPYHIFLIYFYGILFEEVTNGCRRTIRSSAQTGFCDIR